MTDYYSILSEAVASLKPNTAQTRAALFERARGILINHIKNSADRWNGGKAEAEVVWRGHEAWDAGFELVKPDATFWGLK